MLQEIARNWWVLLLRGLLAILFGVLALLWPGLALVTLVLLFGVYALVDGVLTIFSAWQERAYHDRWGLALLEGLVSVAAGALAMAWPAISALALLLVIAAWAMVTGSFEWLAAIRLRREIEGELWLGLSGLLSIIVGVLLVVLPGPGALALVWLIATYAILFGGLLIILAFRLGGLPKDRDRLSGVAS